MNNNKILLLGLDGACFDFVDPLMRQGKLPTLKRLIDDGVRANLRSTIPPTTIPAWVSMFTGLSEGKLGCFGQQWWKKSNHTLEPVSILSWKGKLLWDVVSERKKVGVFRMQTLSRSYPINGFMITDIYAWGGSSQRNVYPPGLFDELQDFWIDKETEEPVFTSMQIKLALGNFGKRIKAANYLLKNKEMDLFIFITRIPDIVSHFTANVRKLQLTYEVIDNGLTILVDQAKKKGYNILIVSDHGTGRQANRRFCANDWLENNGFLTRIRKESPTTSRLSRLVIDRFIEALRKRGFSPLLRSVAFFVGQKMSKIAISPLSAMSERIQWEHTRAFSYEGYGTGYAGIQTFSRELLSDSSVDSDEYERLRKELCNKLKTYRDPQNGQRVVEEVFLKEQVFRGHNLHSMPDIILKLNPNYMNADSASFSSSVVSSDKQLIHTESGVFIANGQIFKKGLNIEDPNIVDVSPTVLHILDIPVPKDMDGNVLKFILSKESGLVEKETKYQESKQVTEDYQTTREEKKEIRDKLRALGYI